MAAMELKVGSGVVGKVLNYRPVQVAQKVITTALDGTVYAQKTGDPVQKYVVDAYSPSAIYRGILDTACSRAEEVSFTNRSNVEIPGVIEEESIEWKEWPDGHGVAKFTLIRH